MSIADVSRRGTRARDRFGAWRFRMFVRGHVLVYRATRGRIGSRIARNDVLLLTTVGRRTGRRRTTPLIFVADRDTWAVAASIKGADRHPGWFLNLAADPVVDVQYRAARHRARAHVVDSGAEHARLWSSLAASLPDLVAHQARTSRVIQIVLLEQRRADVPAEKGRICT